MLFCVTGKQNKDSSFLYPVYLFDSSIVSVVGSVVFSGPEIQ